MSPGDFVLLVQLARRTFRNCQQAGNEYTKIASEVRCLYSVLRTVRTLAERPDSTIFQQDRTTTAQLTNCADGCKHVLDDLDDMLAKYATLNGDGRPNVGKKVWQRFKFGSKVEELGVIRGKLITYTSTLSILLDTIHSRALDRVETKIEDGFGEVRGEFEKMRREIYSMAVQARAMDKNGSSLSLLSLSTYAGDEKEVWRVFRRELITKGFQSGSLDRYGHVLQAYMLKLDQSGLLDNARAQESTSTNELNETPWWSNRIFADTLVSLPRLSLIDIDEEPSAGSGAILPPAAAIALDPPPTGKQAKAGSDEAKELQEPSQNHFPDAQNISCEPGPPRRKVAFATASANPIDSTANRKVTRSIKSILRHPTPKFPEDPLYVREGTGSRAQCLDGKVPQDARITILDKQDIDITAVRWLIPRCEEREKHIVVFKTLDDAHVEVFTNLTAIFRGTTMILHSQLVGLLTHPYQTIPT